MGSREWLLCALTLFCASQTAQGCSCTIESISRSRADAIRDDFLYSTMVYTARVVGATCNCVNRTTRLNCVSYTQESAGLSAEVVAMGECEGGSFTNGLYNVDMCNNLNEALSISTAIDIMPGTNLPTVNLTAMATFGACPLVCPFNAENPDDYLYMASPCQYIVEVQEVFKPENYTGVSTMTVFGPDILTSCGSPGRRLSIYETYMIGVGGACNPFPEWTTLDSFTTEEICLLRELRGDESRLCEGPTNTTAATSDSTDTMATTQFPFGNSGRLSVAPSLLSLTAVLLFLMVTR